MDNELRHIQTERGDLPRHKGHPELGELGELGCMEYLGFASMS